MPILAPASNYMRFLHYQIITSTLVLTAMVSRVAHAAELKDAAGNLRETGAQSYGASTADTQSAEGYLPSLIGGIIQVALLVIGTVLLLLIVYGGYTWMIARGDTEKIKTAKEIITNAVIGIIIVFAAYAISSFVLTKIIEATGASSA